MERGRTLCCTDILFSPIAQSKLVLIILNERSSYLASLCIIAVLQPRVYTGWEGPTPTKSQVLLKCITIICHLVAAILLLFEVSQCVLLCTVI